MWNELHHGHRRGVVVSGVRRMNEVDARWTRHTSYTYKYPVLQPCLPAIGTWAQRTIRRRPRSFEGNFGNGHFAARCKVYEIEACDRYSQRHSVGGSSDADFRCRRCIAACFTSCVVVVELMLQCAAVTPCCRKWTSTKTAWYRWKSSSRLVAG